jgi:LysM repeat protein
MKTIYSVSTSIHKKTVVLLWLFFIVLASAAAVHAAPAAVDAAHAASTGYYHTVRYGESLSVIARNYGTSMQAILSANPQVTNPNLIYAGTVLFIPAYIAPPVGYIVAQPAAPIRSCRFHHFVAYGDHLIALGRHYGVSPFAIAEANQIYNLNRIYAGQYLCIP